MKKLIPNPEYYVLIAATVISALVSVLDFLGLLDSIPWLSNRIPTLILLLVSVVLGYLVVERRNKLDVIEKLIQSGNLATVSTVTTGVDHIINALKGIDIRLFEHREDFFVYLQERVKTAKRSIDATHFGLSAPSNDIALGQNYYKTFMEVVKKGKVKARRIVIVRDQAQVEWERQMLTELSGYNFFLGCFIQPSVYIPMFNMIIIDGEEVCIGGGERIPSYDVKTISVTHSDFTKVMQEHFDILWRESLRINDRGLQEDFLTQLENAIIQLSHDKKT